MLIAHCSLLTGNMIDIVRLWSSLMAHKHLISLVVKKQIDLSESKLIYKNSCRFEKFFNAETVVCDSYRTKTNQFFRQRVAIKLSCRASLGVCVWP